VEVVVRFTDGGKTTDKLIRATSVEDLKRAVNHTLAMFDAADALDAQIAVGPFDPIMAPPPPPPPPDPKDVEKAEWNVALAKLRRVAELAALGVIDAAAVEEFRAPVRDGYKVEYVTGGK
jgi:sugar phosphate isomerase/epimerase